jgi:hypothetical protein
VQLGNQAIDVVGIMHCRHAMGSRRRTQGGRGGSRTAPAVGAGTILAGSANAMLPHRRLPWIGLAALVVIGLFRPLLDWTATTGEAGAPAPEPPGVRVEHVLVTASVVGEQRRRPRAPAAAGPRQTAIPSSAPVAHPNTRPDGFVSKARRLILGDGRHRPEPFPRAR